MSTLTVFSHHDIERATRRIESAREFEKQFGNWVDIAKLCYEIERDRDFAVLGYATWNQWLAQEMPHSRSYVYLVVRRYKELSVDISEEELAQIPLGSAGVLKQLSSAQRRESKIRQSARQRPEKFVADLQAMAPNQHIEARVEKTLKFTASQWGVVSAAYEAYCLVDETASLETFIEWMVTETQ